MATAHNDNINLLIHPNSLGKAKMGFDWSNTALDWARTGPTRPCFSGFLDCYPIETPHSKGPDFGEVTY
jgi:hypothetical protein